MKIRDSEISEMSIRSTYNQNGMIRLCMQIIDRSAQTDTDIRVYFNLDITSDVSHLYCENVSELVEGTTEIFQIASSGTCIKISRMDSCFNIKTAITKKDGYSKAIIAIQWDKTALLQFLNSLKEVVYSSLEIREASSEMERDMIKVCVSDVTDKGDCRRGRISLDSPWFHISRNVSWVKHQVEMFKNYIDDFLEHRKDSLSVYEDFMDFTITNGCSCQIKGEVSDFRWPETNDIFFQGECDCNQVVHELRKFFF